MVVLIIRIRMTQRFSSAWTMNEPHLFVQNSTAWATERKNNNVLRMDSCYEKGKALYQLHHLLWRWCTIYNIEPAVINMYIYTLSETNSSHLKIGHPLKGNFFSNHPSSCVMLSSGRIYLKDSGVVSWMEYHAIPLCTKPSIIDWWDVHDVWYLNTFVT